MMTRSVHHLDLIQNFPINKMELQKFGIDKYLSLKAIIF
jgi:hypothetical protein